MFPERMSKSENIKLCTLGGGKSRWRLAMIRYAKDPCMLSRDWQIDE
jgi:hypothetical protein